MTSVLETGKGTVPTEVTKDEAQVVIPSSALPGGDPPSAVLITPWGEVKSAHGTFVVDEESGRQAIEAFEEHGADLPIDYEHQTLGGQFSSPTGQAPAAGWIRALRAVVPGEDAGDGAGLYADVEWTESARAKLIAREYRYLSPVVIVSKRDRRMVALHSAALTNKPAIVGMKPIVNRAEMPRGPETAPERDRTGDAVESLRMRLGLPTDSLFESVVAAAHHRLAVLIEELAEREAEQRVSAVMRAGKLAPAQRAWALKLALNDPPVFDEWAASAPAVVVPGRTEWPAGGGTADGRDRAAVIASARAVFRSEPMLALLTSEQAWVRQALREAGLEICGNGDEGGKAGGPSAGV